MILLILGVALWWLAHLFKRIAPAKRAQLGDKGRGMVTAALAVSIVLMVLGFRGSAEVFIWAPPTWAVHVNNLLILIALYMMSPAPKKGLLLNGMRHPMLTGFSLWAAAHLLVNGDLASVLLFGGLLAWALIEMQVINRAQPEWTPGPKGKLAKDALFLAVSIPLMLVIGYVHSLLGYWPFAG